MTTRGRVLMYHAFGHREAARDPHNLFVPVAELRWQLEHLLGHGWRPLTLDGYLAGMAARSWPRKTFLLTIDDGHRSTLDAVPVLAELRVPSVLFVPPAVLGGTSAWMPLMPDAPMLSEDELRDVLAAAPVELGGHGWDHADMLGMGPDQLRRHTVEVADELERIAGTRPRSFAYPRGVYDAASLRAVAEAGYVVGFATTSDGGVLAVPRLDVNATDTRRTFRLKASAAWPAVAAAASRAPAARRLAHRVVGSARRG